MRKLGVVLLIVLGLVGCGTKLVYNNMDWFLIAYLEDYVELDGQQESIATQQIEQLSHWHRKEEIPTYIEHLNQLIALDAKTFTEDELELQQAMFTQHVNRLLLRLEPVLLELIQGLSDEQTEELLDNIRVRHTKYKNKYSPLSEHQIRERYQERIEDNLETWLGKLTPEQNTLVTQWVNELEIASYEWVGHQTNVRIKLKELLLLRANTSAVQPLFHQLLFNSDEYYSPELSQILAHNKQVGNERLVAIVNLMTAKQTQHFRDELMYWRDLALDIQ